MKPVLFAAISLCVLPFAALAQEAEAPKPLTPAEAATLFKTPTRVSVSANDSPVSEAFVSLLNQAHLPPSSNMGGASSEKVTFDAQNQPFWDTVLKLQKASGWGLFHGSSGRGDLPTYSLAIYPNAGDGLRQSQGPCDAFI